MSSTTSHQPSRSRRPFGARLADAMDDQGPLCVGIDPHPSLLEAWGLTDSAAGLRDFALRTIDAVGGRVAAVKPQSAFFERHGSAGIAILEETLAALRDVGTLSVLDVNAYPSVLVVVIVALLLGTAVGAVNGLVITRFRVAPFIATLGTLYMARGVALLISKGATYPDLAGEKAFGNTGFSFLGVSRPLGLPTSVWLMIIFTAVVALVIARAPFGRWLYAVGGNERAAELSGVPVKHVKMRVYMVSGCLAALAGLIIASELTAAAPAAGETYEMNAIAAVVIGGASLAGGRGDVKGALIGAFLGRAVFKKHFERAGIA